MATRQAIITYDPAWIEAWGSSAQWAPMNHIFTRALSGHDYPRERGIISIRHVPEGNEIIVAPVPGADTMLKYDPCITLPLDLLEELLRIADASNAKTGKERLTIDAVRREVAGTRERFDELTKIELTAVPRMTHEELIRVSEQEQTASS
jgi:hypothetical protein